MPWKTEAGCIWNLKAIPLPPGDLRRFREYEAAVSRTFGVAVVTYVICSSQVKRLKSELTEGINTYRVKVIRLKNRNSDLLFERLKKKKALGEPLTKEDLTPLLLAPLMSGSMDIEERITESITMIQEAGAALSELEMEKNAGSSLCPG